MTETSFTALFEDAKQFLKFSPWYIASYGKNI